MIGTPARGVHDGVVIPPHRCARALSALPGSARLLWRLPTDSRSIALTFDDGPDLRHTPALVELLSRHAARATFFVLTDDLRRTSGIVRQAAAAGHDIGVHGDRHESLVGLPLRGCTERLRGMRGRLEDAVGREVTFYRPPYGRVSLTLLRACAHAALDVVLWTHDPRDWDTASPAAARDRLVRCLRPGAVVLLHDHWQGSGGALDQGLRVARELGLALHSLSGALAEAPPVTATPPLPFPGTSP